MPYERERETQPRPLRDYLRRPITMITAGCLAPGDLVHDADNRELRGLVVHVRLAIWGKEPVAWVHTSEDVATRRVGRESTLLVTRGR